MWTEIMIISEGEEGEKVKAEQFNNLNISRLLGISLLLEKWFVRQFIKYDDRLMATNSGSLG